MIDGEVVDRGAITFHPVGGGPVAKGRIDDAGGFVVSVGRGNTKNINASTIPIGDYKVTITVTAPSSEAVREGGPPAAGPRLMAAKYGGLATTDLERSVVTGDNVFSFDLDRAEPAELVDESSGDAGQDRDALEGVPAEDDAPSATESEAAVETTLEGVTP